MAKKRRASGEGCVRKIKNGRWRGELTNGYSDEGKQIKVSFSGGTKAEVLEKMESFKTNQKKQISLDKKLSFQDWADSWYVDYESQVQPSTYAGYKYTLKLLKEKFGKQPLCDILPIHINRYLDGMVKKGYSMSQLRKCRAMLIQIFDAADNNGLVTVNAARKAKVIRDPSGALSTPKREKDSFTEQEVALLEEQLPDTLLGHSIRLLLNTGMRVQELLALTPNDITPDGSMIKVNKAIKMVNGTPVLGPTKSKKGNRSIPVPEHARPYAHFVRSSGGNKLIWARMSENPYYSVGTFRRQYYSALDRIPDVRRLSPHCCRHTYITMLQEKGVSIEMVARLAGHSSIETTDHYTHISNDTLAQAVSALERGGSHHAA